MKDRGKTVLLYLVVAVVMLGTAYGILRFPAGLVTSLFMPVAAQKDLADETPRIYTGYRAGNDIVRLEGMSQYEDGTLTRLDYVTVETKNIIPMKAYRLKDPGDRYSRDQYLGSGRAYLAAPLRQYTTRPDRRDYLYGRYYILGLSDGSNVAAYADISYGALSILGRKVTFPVGRLRMADTQEKEFLEAVEEKYSIDTNYVLYMINDMRVSDLNFLDLLVRAVMGTVIVALEFLLLLILLRNRKKP